MNLSVFHGAASADLPDPLPPPFSIVPKSVHARLSTRPEEDDVRQGPRIEQKGQSTVNSSREKKPVNRSQKKGAVDRSRGKLTVRNYDC